MNKKYLMSVIKGSCMGLMAACLVVCSILASAQNMEPPLKISLDDALKIAFTQGSQVRLDSIRVDKVHEDRKAIIAKLFPTIDLGGEYSYTIKKQVMYFGGSDNDAPPIPGMPDMSKGFEVGRTHNVSGGLTVGMPLIAPQLWTSLKLNKQQVEAVLLDVKLSQAALTQNIKKAYYGLQLAIETAKVLEQSYHNAEINSKDIAKKYEAGLVALYDKIRAEVQVKNLEPQLLQAQNAVNDARRMLNILMGVEVERETRPESLDLDREDTGFETEANNEALKLLRGAQSIDFLALRKTDKAIEMMQYKERLAKEAFLPTLSLGGFARIYAMDDSFKIKDYQWTPYSAVQLTLKIPIFSGGERLSALRKARMETDELMIQRQEQKKNLIAETHKLKERLQMSLKKIASAREAVRMAGKGYQIAKSRYDTGASTLVELNDADLALLQAKLNLRQAAYDFFVVKADIENLRGDTYQESVEQTNDRNKTDKNAEKHE